MFREPMLAAPIDRVPSGEEYLMEVKWDGWRAMCAIHRAGAWMATRTGNRIDGVPYLNEALVSLAPADTVLDGEIVDLAAAAERQWNRTQTILSRNRAHRPSEADPPLTLVVFDVLVVDGVDVMGWTLAERQRALDALFAAQPADQAHLVVCAERHPAGPEKAQALLEAGFEGVVVKRRDSRYLPGSRSGGWHKWKPDLETEAVCTGFYEGDAAGKYASGLEPGLFDLYAAARGRGERWSLGEPAWVGGICFRVTHEDGRVYDGRASGMSDAERREMARHPERYIGRVIELTYKAMTADGALRHPQYRRLRDPLEKAADGWVCEQHPDQEWPHNDCAGPGMPRRDTNPTGGTMSTRAPRTVPSTPPRSPGRRQRNYRAMADHKLRDVLAQLSAGPGHDAYDRCVSRGSGDPAADLAECQRLATEKGLI